MPGSSGPFCPIQAATWNEWAVVHKGCMVQCYTIRWHSECVHKSVCGSTALWSHSCTRQRTSSLRPPTETPPLPPPPMNHTFPCFYGPQQHQPLVGGLDGGCRPGSWVWAIAPQCHHSPPRYHQRQQCSLARQERLCTNHPFYYRRQLSISQPLGKPPMITFFSNFGINERKCSVNGWIEKMCLVPKQGKGAVVSVCVDLRWTGIRHQGSGE